jgi:hypothetical protein
MEYHKIETLFERNIKTFKVDPDKLRNSVYGIIKSWEFTEKIDGTNIRIEWDPMHIPELKLNFGGKTDNASIPAELTNWLIANVSIGKLEEIFPDTRAVIYGEGYGAGIQRGSHYSPTKQFIVFDVLVGDKWWLNRDNVCDVSAKLGLKVVPFVGTMTLEEGVEMVKRSFLSILAKEQTGQLVPAEGLVGRTVETLFDKKGARIIIKLKTKDF